MSTGLFIAFALVPIGLGFAALERASTYAKERVVFGRPIARTRASSSRSRAPMRTCRRRTSCATRRRAVRCRQACGAEANMSLLLGAGASWEAANACLQTHGGYGFAQFHLARPPQPPDDTGEMNRRPVPAISVPDWPVSASSTENLVTSACALA
ncbi:MAG: acyl-CoA/acyl-ACP dehydrogenase [Phyllobacteriaceae bacterium]|nr:acyl-CoA/acyl-ACP dehydrogenase [Phyllobacteriaceae bacterium]